ncbi:30S ribosomal protein S13 [Candidatus Dojkabacteria bacterium]|nr:30S ribosomal protein S13 [Candidatus Dojkabacteria bacterium]
MARFRGVEVPDEKKVWVSLTYIHGIGQTLAKSIVEKAGISESIRTKDLTSAESTKLLGVLEEYILEGELRQKNLRNIKRLKEIRCYRGIRHKLGLPVRGQRTRHNAHTRKGKSLPIGGLKHTLEKT